MLTSANKIGFYGKLPIVGDFVHRRLPQDFVRPWDNWLQSALLTSHKQLGAEWKNRYLTSAIWRFILSAGLCGNKAVAGIMMPSVDKVGRYYPLTVATLFECALPISDLLTQENQWFESLEEVALNALENDLSLHDFDSLIQATPAASFMKQTICDNQPFDFMSGYSLWNTTGNEATQPTLFSYKGLPPLNCFALFLNGQNGNQNTLIAPSTLFASSKNNVRQETQNSHLCWQSWAITDTGKRRKHNEDSLLDKPDARLWVVADGMGGHQAGDVASQLIVNRLKTFSASDALEDYVAKVADNLQNINHELRQLAREKYANKIVGSTVVALICEAQQAAFLWAGDSRLYRFRDNQLQQLTRDHSANDSETASISSVKTSNVITRAIGAADSLELDVKITSLSEDDVFLLCSDGLDKEVSFQEIEQIMQTHPLADIADTLVQKVLERGARDNVTVIVVAQTRGN